MLWHPGASFCFVAASHTQRANMSFDGFFFFFSTRASFFPCSIADRYVRLKAIDDEDDDDDARSTATEGSEQKETGATRPSLGVRFSFHFRFLFFLESILACSGGAADGTYPWTRFSLYSIGMPSLSDVEITGAVNGSGQIFAGRIG